MVSLFYLVILLAMVGAGVFSALSREGLGRTLGFVVAWLGIFALVFVVYSLRFEFKDLAEGVLSEFDPTRAVSKGESVVVKKGEGGHFNVRSRVNGEEVLMLVDTGASKVVLTSAHAKLAGYDPEEMVYSVRLSTANGESWAARVVLDEVRVGNIVLRDVVAYVNKGDMGEHSLLGMNFLNRLDGFSVSERGLELQGEGWE